MKDIIKRILREEYSDDEMYDSKGSYLSKEERIAIIEKRKEYILKVIPKMIKFFEKKYSGYLEKIEVDQKKVFLGSEQHMIVEPQMNFYFSELPDSEDFTRATIYNMLKDFFNIKLNQYGTPFNFQIFKKTWTKI